MEERMMTMTMTTRKRKQKKKKTSPIIIIKKKLQELESELNALMDDGFSMAKTGFPQRTDEDRLMVEMTVLQAMHHKLAFIKSLLSAEISSNPSRHTHRRRLARIADRVQSLESAFLDPRLGLLASSSSATAAAADDAAAYSSTVTVNDRDDTDDDRDHSDREIGGRGGGGAYDDQYSSSCSCTESCRNDDGGVEVEEEERAAARGVNNAVGLAMYVNPVFQADQRSGLTEEAEEDDEENDGDEDVDETVSSKVGSMGCNDQCCYWKGVASGAVIGAMAMWMVILSGGFDYSWVDQPHSRLPPT